MHPGPSELDQPGDAINHSSSQIPPGTSHPSPTVRRTSPIPSTCPEASRNGPPHVRETPALQHGPSSPINSDALGALSPGAIDRVFPIRSVVQVDPTATPSIRQHQQEGYFGTLGRASDARKQPGIMENMLKGPETSRQASSEVPSAKGQKKDIAGGSRNNLPRLPPQVFQEIISNRPDSAHEETRPPSIAGTSSIASVNSVTSEPDVGGLITARFKHVITEGGHAVITGRDGEILQRCEDEPIHIPGAIQGFGLLVALLEDDGKFVVRIISENSKRIIGYTPKEMFELDSFTDILSDEQADNLLDHIDFIRDEDADVATNGPEVFTISIRTPRKRSTKFWCAMHINDRNPNFIICEFELEDDVHNPLVPPDDLTPMVPEDTLNSNPTAEELEESTQNMSRPLRVLRSARKRKGEAAAMEVFNIMSQVQEQLAAAPTLASFLKVLVGVVKELTGFHRVMVYQFDQQWNGRVVTELVDPRATKDLYKGLHFPASDIPKQARDLYRINRVRLLYDRDQETARLVCRTIEDLETPLDLSFSYLRAMSPIHLKYLQNMSVRSSMSVSINAFNELWGLISCHSYGSRGTRVAFPIRKMCRLVGDTASRNIERLSYASRLQARKLINTAPTQHNPSGYIIASSEDLLKLFDADFGLLSIRDETKMLGHIEHSQEALAMLEYLRMRRITSVTTTQDITQDFPDLKYGPGFQVVAGMLIVPLSSGGNDFIVFFRKGQLKQVKWAGNPYEKFIKEGTEGYLEPRKSFRTWSETVVGRCREWTEEEVETAAVLCLVYGKFIEVWRQKEAAVQNSQLTRLLLANSAHEVRTPLNAIINYLEIALEGTLDHETRDNLAKSHSASKSLIYVINDLLDLTKTEEGGDLIKGEVFDLKATLKEATDPFAGDAKRKRITYEVIEYPGVPKNVIGDQRKVRQAISNITANAIQHTVEGGVKIEMYVSSREEAKVSIEVGVQDSGVGMNATKLDSLFKDLEQVQSEDLDFWSASPTEGSRHITGGHGSSRTLGLGLAIVARIVRNMNGQLRLKSEESKGSRFVVQFPFDLPDSEQFSHNAPEALSPPASTTPQAEIIPGEVTLVDGNKSRASSISSGALARQNSIESLNSQKSMKSFGSGASHNSARSDVDRLIEAIREPHHVDGKRPAGERSRNSWNAATKPILQKRHSYGTGPISPQRTRAKSLEAPAIVVPETERSLQPGPPGEESLSYSGTSVKALKMPEEVGSPLVPRTMRPSSSGAVLGEVHDRPEKQIEEPLNAENLHILVAEDDPVNSKIVKKRMEKLGHDIHLTGNGEECAGAYGDHSDQYDVVLMDMQMPIVDGLTSTKMIRSFEKSHSKHVLSKRAALNGRVPIVAVSASLVERERQMYIDAGFDAWILKPISFPRLNEIMSGIVDPKIRSECVYTPGKWEQGGWFSKAHPEEAKGQADTRPKEEKIPTNAPSDEVRAAVAGGGPLEGDSTETVKQVEWQELDEEQDDRNPRPEGESSEVITSPESHPKSFSAPQLGMRGLPPDEETERESSENTIEPRTSITGEVVATPEPIK